MGLLLANVVPDTGLAYDMATFDGTNDYLTKGGGFSGAPATSAKGIISLRCNLATVDADFRVLFDKDHGGCQGFRDSDNKFYLVLSDNTFSNYVQVTTDATIKSSLGEFTLLASWDLSAGAGSRSVHLYINDLSNNLPLADVGGSAVDITWSGELFYVGIDHFLSALPIDAALGEFYLQIGEYLDFSNAANRRKFINADNSPVDLGADGSTPTGTVPTMYLRRAPAAAANTFAVNLGSGMGLTLTGSLT